MKQYIGIDLGTTNSAICSYDGENLRLFKSPEQNDVTPSAIYYHHRGNKYTGRRAYDSAPFDPENAATLFKRLMGTSTPIRIKSQNLTLTPEQCSAEILRVLFGYLPEEIRNDDNVGAVITVPAAFNQMQKDATLSAAEMAGVGKVALMQEPVAAVMSVMRTSRIDGVFIIFDMGGGTLDVALAQSIAGRVSLLAQGGIEMCGGREWDRLMFDNVIKKWLLNNFDLHENFVANERYRSLHRAALWAVEKAKIELSANEESIVDLDEDRIRVKDSAGVDIYLQVPLSRKELDELIAPKINDSLESARRTLEKAGFSPHDVERIVFIGGPTNYKPLRDKVSFELGVPASTDLNPMTAVAEGAALFAESIDWKSQRRARKSSRGAISIDRKLNLAFKYISRTPDSQAKVIANIKGSIADGIEFQLDSLDTGWSSGRIRLENGTSAVVPLAKQGDNVFKVFVFDPSGGPVSIANDKIKITKTAATVDAIPASYSIGIEVLDKLGGMPVLEYLVRAGDSLPTKGQKKFKAAESLRAGAPGSVNLKLWEGDIEDPVSDNRFIGMLKITGNDIEDGVIVSGADLVCDYEILDSGNIVLEVSVPSIGCTFHSGHNFYSRVEGQIDFTTAAKRIKEESKSIKKRAEDLAEKIDEPKIDSIREKLEAASNLEVSESDPERCKQAWDNIHDAKRLLSEVREERKELIRQLELDRTVQFFDEFVRESASPAEQNNYDNLSKTAQRAIDNADPDFENLLDQLKGKNFEILWRQDWFVVEKFKWLIEESHLFPDQERYAQLLLYGKEALESDDIQKLRRVVQELSMIKIGVGINGDMNFVANILRG